MIQLPVIVTVAAYISLADASFISRSSATCCSSPRVRTKKFDSLRSNFRPFADKNNDGDHNNDVNNLAAIERDVLESTKARLDLKRVASILDDDVNGADRAISSTSNMSLTWKISLAAALGAGTVTFLAFKNVYIAGIVALATAVAAMGDPLEEESIAGALARVVGRLTLQSVDVTQSKVRAMARAIVVGEEEISTLKAQLDEKERELAELRRWKEIRMAVDEALPRLALDDLKELARQNGIMVGGTKAQLLTRLVEAGIIVL